MLVLRLAGSHGLEFAIRTGVFMIGVAPLSRLIGSSSSVVLSLRSCLPLMSELSGQSGHYLHDRFRKNRAKSAHWGEIFARASRAVLLSDAVTMPLPSRLNAMLRTSLYPRGRTLFRSRPSRASRRPPDAADLLVTDGKIALPPPGLLDECGGLDEQFCSDSARSVRAE